MSSAHEPIGDHPALALRWGNWLTVNNRSLRADVLEYPGTDKISVSPAELERILIIGRRPILHGIEGFYNKQVAKNPGSTIARPAIFTAMLGTTAQTDGRWSEVFTEKGYANGDLIQSPDEIKYAFWAHWNAVKNAGFLPEVRRTTIKGNDGSWLSLRKPTIDDILHHWIGWNVDLPDDATAMIEDLDKETQRKKLRLYRMLGERAVDQAPDIIRTREQIGFLLAMAATKLALGDKEGYEKELDDLFDYADNAPDTDIAITTVRAIENSTFELDQTGDE